MAIKTCFGSPLPLETGPTTKQRSLQFIKAKTRKSMCSFLSEPRVWSETFSDAFKGLLYGRLLLLQILYFAKETVVETGRNNRSTPVFAKSTTVWGIIRSPNADHTEDP